MPRKAKGASSATPDDSQAAPPPPKRARNAQSRVKGRKGALRGVLELPMDLIWEICTHLDVGDLLTLSNTNKAFRSVVTGESSRTLFKRARQRIGLPELLSPIPDLRYAELMYGKGCHICGKANAGKIDPWFRARICQACYKDKFVEPGRFQFNRAVRGLNRYTIFCSPCTVALKRNERSYYTSSLKKVSDELNAKFPDSATNLSTRDDNKQAQTEIAGMRSQVEVDEDKIKELEAAVASRKADWRYVASLFNGTLPGSVERLPPEGAFQEWYLDFHKIRDARDKDAQALQEWLKDVKIRKTKENEKISTDRREEIERRFEALGFEKSEFERSDFLNHPQVKSTRPLSDRTFSTIVEPHVRQLLEEGRRNRLRSMIKKQYGDSIKDRSDRDYLPPPHVFVQVQSLESIVNDASRNPPDSFLLSPAAESAARQDGAKLVRDRREKFLRTIVSAYMQLAEESKEKEEEEKEKEKEKAHSSPSQFCPIDKLPLELPRLPPWIPRSNDEPILASDEQLTTFLETSPLALLVECSKCQKAFTVRGLFKHFSWSGIHSIWSDAGPPSEQKAEDWMRVGELDQEEKQFARIDKNLLSLSLKLQQLVESTPLVVDGSRRLPSLESGESLGEEKPDCFDVSLVCTCNSAYQGRHETRFSGDPVLNAYNWHLLRSTNCSIKSSVDYSVSYREARRRPQQTSECASTPSPRMPSIRGRGRYYRGRGRRWQL
ncbi:F-box protein [Sporobolomyces salmoneus]|uniref:F-box protein n=1 Tax=Sporobolomyces salmoneus TaxID=183962 RepID=UPI00317DA1A2